VVVVAAQMALQPEAGKIVLQFLRWYFLQRLLFGFIIGVIILALAARLILHHLDGLLGLLLEGRRRLAMTEDVRE